MKDCIQLKAITRAELFNYDLETKFQEANICWKIFRQLSSDADLETVLVKIKSSDDLK